LTGRLNVAPAEGVRSRSAEPESFRLSAISLPDSARYDRAAACPIASFIGDRTRGARRAWSVFESTADLSLGADIACDNGIGAAGIDDAEVDDEEARSDSVRTAEAGAVVAICGLAEDIVD
jgi:hypothetical protein